MTQREITCEISKRKRVRILRAFTPLLVAASLGARGQADVIGIGQAAPLSGPFALPNEGTTDPVYHMCLEEVNARGGIYLSKYDRWPAALAA